MPKYTLIDPRFGDTTVVIEAPSKRYIVDAMESELKVWACEEVQAMLQEGIEFDEDENPEAAVFDRLEEEMITALKEVE